MLLAVQAVVRRAHRGDEFTDAPGILQSGRRLDATAYVDRLGPQLVRDCERAVREGRMSLAESQALRRFYDGELNGYTYLEPD